MTRSTKFIIKGATALAAARVGLSLARPKLTPPPKSVDTDQAKFHTDLLSKSHCGMNKFDISQLDMSKNPNSLEHYKSIMSRRWHESKTHQNNSLK